jgi:hypothetical protein
VPTSGPCHGCVDHCSVRMCVQSPHHGCCQTRVFGVAVASQVYSCSPKQNAFCLIFRLVPEHHYLFSRVEFLLVSVLCQCAFAPTVCIRKPSVEGETSLASKRKLIQISEDRCRCCASVQMWESVKSSSDFCCFLLIVSRSRLHCSHPCSVSDQDMHHPWLAQDFVLNGNMCNSIYSVDDQCCSICQCRCRGTSYNLMPACCTHGCEDVVAWSPSLESGHKRRSLLASSVDHDVQNRCISSVLCFRKRVWKTCSP